MYATSIHQIECTMYCILIFLQLLLCSYGQVAFSQQPDNSLCYRDSECQSNLCLCNTCRTLSIWKVPNFGKCTDHTQCQSGYCEGGSPYHCGGQCQDRLLEGQDCARGGWRQCQSNVCLCGLCRTVGFVENNGKCHFDYECASGWCMGGSGQHCNGRCQQKMFNGADCSRWGYLQCQSGKCLCNQCWPQGNRQVPINGNCQFDSDCVSGWCEGGANTHCNGICKNRLPTGGDCTRWGNNQCNSHRCLCKVCQPQGNHQVALEGRCQFDVECQSNVCDGGSPEHCDGRCKVRKETREQCHNDAGKLQENIVCTCRYF